MTPTKLLIGQILVVLLTALLGVWFATQWCAAQLGFQAALGLPWFRFFGLPVYRPWSLFEWWYLYDGYAPAVFNRAGAIAACSGLLGCSTAIIGSLIRARQSPQVTTYGSSRWAQHREIARAGLFRPAGVILGRLGRRYLRHDGPEHVMAFAPTRSGKGIGLVIPTLLSWTGSAVIHDIKGENWQLTAGWRARFSHVLLLNPTDPRSARYNPLLEVRKGPDEVRDVQNIADILVDPVIMTDRRSYHLALESTERTAMAVISWTYPQDQLLILRRQAKAAEEAEPIADGVDLSSLHFRYAISGDSAPWRPERVFDDGSKVFIAFPGRIDQGEAPPLFVVGPTGESQLVNYRVRRNYYIVERPRRAAYTHGFIENGSMGSISMIELHFLRNICV